MEYIDGASLDDFGLLPPVEAVCLLLPIAGALAFAHGRGVLHRDVKPSNVLCARQPDGTLLPKLVDFGLSSSRLPSNVADAPGCCVGTVGYSPPEQLTVTALDGRVDVWSLCVTLYDLVSEEPAFLGEDEQSVMAAIVSMDTPPPLDELGVADSALASIVAKGMAGAKQERWPTMHDLGAALAKWLLDAGVDVDPYGRRVAQWLS
jgi:serine/threonine-protein kinase